MKINFSQRLTYFFLWAILIPIGMTSRKFRHLMPEVLDLYLGDILWSMMLYFGIRMLWMKPKKHISLIAAWICSLGIELSCLIKWEPFYNFRYTLIGGLIFGSYFNWSDLVCYAIGMVIVYGLDVWLLKEQKPNTQSIKDSINRKYNNSYRPPI